MNTKPSCPRCGLSVNVRECNGGGQPHTDGKRYWTCKTEGCHHHFPMGDAAQEGEAR